MKKIPLTFLQKLAGPCPICGKKDVWINDLPLRAFCWGPEDKEHKEWSRLVPPASDKGSRLVPKEPAKKTA